MDIDITIVIAQVINFLVLVWLLRRFLYQPITTMIASRERMIRDRLDQAAALKNEAETKAVEYERRRADLENRREHYLQEARQEADQALQASLAEGAKAAAQARARWADQLEEDRRNLEQKVEESLVRQVFSVTDQLTREIAGGSLEDGVIDAFARAMEREQFDGRQITPPITWRLSFSPSTKQKARLRALIEQSTGQTMSADDMSFSVDEALLLGVEMEWDGSVVGWTARDYLSGIQTEALDHLEADRTQLPDTAQRAGGSRA